MLRDVASNNLIKIFQLRNENTAYKEGMFTKGRNKDEPDLQFKPLIRL